jgi:CRISPR/Cas system Type II protein with McrA/HNH and RuvC-like nuclease domain
MHLIARHGAEFSDRLAITGTRVLILASLGRKAESKRLRTELTRSVRRTYRRRKEKALRKAQRDYAERLLSAVLSSEGPVFPRWDESIDLDQDGSVITT